MFVLLFVMFVSCQGFLLDSNTQTTTTGGTSLDDKRYNTIMGLLTEERRSRSKLEAIVAQELLALRQEVAKCQCGNGNGGHSQINNQGAPTNDTKVLKEEIIHLKREQELLKTEAAELVQNNTALKDKVVLLERNLTTMQNKQRDLNLRNVTSHLEKALQITDNKLNTVINNANARTQDFIALFQKVIGLEQNHTVLKDNVILLERNISTMANSRNQSFISLSEIVAGLIQNNTVLKDNVIQLEQNFTMEKTKLYLNFRNETSQLEKALQITNNKLNAVTNDANARKQDFIALFQKVQSMEQRLENSRKSLEASQNMTFLRLQKEIINGGKSKILDQLPLCFIQYPNKDELVNFKI